MLFRFCVQFAGCLLLPLALSAQIPNGGFESWSAGEPVGWLTNNVLPTYPLITQTSTAHSGSSAARGSVMTFSAVGYSATLYSGQNGDGISVTSRVGTLKGFYTFTSLSGDQLVASVAMEKNGEGIGVGTSVLPAAAAFTAFTVNITYFTNDVPDTAVIWFAMAGAPAPHVGSTFSIDDLTWEAATSVSDLGLHVPVEVALSPAYPNPFNPSTTIRYSLPVSGRVALTVFDLLGRQVSSLVDAEQAAGHHQVNWSADGMPSGTYLCRLDVLTADGQLTQRAIRLILAK